MFYGHFCAHGKLNGRVTSKDNEAKSRMKQPSVCQRRDLNTGGSDLWSNTLPLDHGGARLDR